MHRTAFSRIAFSCIVIAFPRDVLVSPFLDRQQTATGRGRAPLPEMSKFQLEGLHISFPINPREASANLASRQPRVFLGAYGVAGRAALQATL